MLFKIIIYILYYIILLTQSNNKYIFCWDLMQWQFNVMTSQHHLATDQASFSNFSWKWVGNTGLDLEIWRYYHRTWFNIHSMHKYRVWPPCDTNQTIIKRSRVSVDSVWIIVRALQSRQTRSVMSLTARWVMSDSCSADSFITHTNLLSLHT